jgi:WD40 repeat protein
MSIYVSADCQQPRLVAGSFEGQVRVYDPEAGSVLHCLDGHTDIVADLACIASSSAAPHHPRLVTASDDGTARVWDGETGEGLADLGGHQSMLGAVAVWKEHTAGHDRIATASYDGHVRVWGGEALTLLHDLDIGSAVRALVFKSAEGPARLLVAQNLAQGLQVWDPEEGRLLHGGINHGCMLDDLHLYESGRSCQM